MLCQRKLNMKSQDFLRSYRAIAARPTPPAWTSSPTWFGPDFESDLIRTQNPPFSGQKHRSKSDQNRAQIRCWGSRAKKAHEHKETRPTSPILDPILKFFMWALLLENKGEGTTHIKNLGLHWGPLHSLCGYLCEFFAS